MKKILIIEDNSDVRENLAEILELSNYETMTAENGKIGVQKALTSAPDLILCDVMMPELDGYGVLNILGKKPKTAEIPFIFLTAKTERRDFRKGMNLGADDYITKPFDQSELLDIIEIRLKKSERIKKAFDGSNKGLTAFINELRGQKELEKLTQERTTINYKKKEKIYQEGQRPKQLYFIAAGKVKTYKTNEWGKEYITGVHEAGKFLGYLSLIQEATHLESAAAMEENTAIRLIPKEDFFKMLHHNQNFAARFIKILANNIEEQEEKLLSLAYNSIRKRVAEALVELEMKKNNNDHTIVILREDLASIVGTAKESVIRTLTDFKHEGLISIDHGVISILKFDDLRHLPA
ncbi:MAG TPA: response regulator [Phaeodactylibacter sp.]|nr:response regulator [Phaeodactylibacter sp.]